MKFLALSNLRQNKNPVNFWEILPILYIILIRIRERVLICVHSSISLASKAIPESSLKKIKSSLETRVDVLYTR